jgi:RNA polymerase sigma-70 factor (ECF subfamily)
MSEHMGNLRQTTNDRDAEFGRLFRSHHAAIFAFARRRADAALAQDVTAETFAIAWRRWDDLPHDRPLPWLYGVARLTLANLQRSERRQHALAEALALAFRPPLSDEPTGAVTAALNHLNDDDRDTLLLVAWEGLSPREAATALGVSYATFRVRSHRARRRLAKALVASGYRPRNTTPTQPPTKQLESREPRYG